MKQKLTLSLTLLAAFVGFLTWWFSTTQVLKRRSSELMDCLRMEAGTGRIQRAFKADKLRELIDRSVTVSYPRMQHTFSNAYTSDQPVTLDQDRAQSALLYLTEMAEWISVNNQTIEVTNSDATTATVAISFDLATKMKGRSEQSTSLKGQLSFQYTNKRWLVREAAFE